MNLASLVFILIAVSGCKSVPSQQQNDRTRAPSSACRILKASEATEWIDGKTILKVTYLVGVENSDQFKPNDCLSSEFIQYEGRNRCSAIHASIKRTGIVEFSIVTQNNDGESPQFALRGNCEEESTFQSGKPQIEFKAEEQWNLIKPLQ